MAKWTESFRVGEQVEALVLLANGTEWRPAKVVRKTATGIPVVSVAEFEHTLACRKSDIRKAETTHTH